MALLLDRMVKFRRQKYEDLSGADSARSQGRGVEFQSVPTAGTPTPTTPAINAQPHRRSRHPAHTNQHTLAAIIICPPSGRT